jgi:hypothetical protein
MLKDCMEQLSAEAVAGRRIKFQNGHIVMWIP